MRKVLFTVLLLILLLASSACAYDRYMEATRTTDGDIYYLDTESVTRGSNNDIVRFWVKISVSQEGRNYRIANARTKEEKKWLQKLREVKQFFEIDFSRNTIRSIETISYDSKGHVIDDLQTPYSNWSNIAPSSVGEVLQTMVKALISITTGYRPHQPFILPDTSQSMTWMQRQTWNELQGYLADILTRPDFDDFYKWYVKNVAEAGVTMEQVSEGLYRNAMNNGGNFLTVIEVIEGWYQTFRREYSRK